MFLGNVIILRTGILYSIIICALISFSCFYSSFLISLKPKKTEDDDTLSIFLNVTALYWLIYMISNIFGWIDVPSFYKPLSYLLNLIFFLQPIPLLYYFIKSRYTVIISLLYGIAFYYLSLGDTMKLTTVSFWGVQAGMAQLTRFAFLLGFFIPLAIAALVKAVQDFKSRAKPLFIELIAMVFILVKVAGTFFDNVTWELLLIRMNYIFIGFIAYFYLTGEEATPKIIQDISPWVKEKVLRLRAMRVPFFAKLLLLFIFLSVLPIAAAGILLFLTFKEIIDIYIYKPLLWNLKTSKEEFLVALGNVQIQALFLITLTIILVVIASSIASRAIAQSLRRIGYGMKRLEEGDFAYKVSPESNDEIGDLANYFNRMASEIKRSREIMENWNRELEKTVAERTKILQILYDLSKAMGSTLDLNELLSRSIGHIPSIAGSSCIAVFLLDDKGEYQVRISRECPKLPSFRSGEGLFGEAVVSQQIVKIADIKEASSKEKEMLEPVNIRTLLLVPMERKGKRLGLMFIGVQKEYMPSDIELNLMSTIADQMAISVENAKVYEKEKEAVKRLIEIDKMKTELISMVSHELRTPLTSIKGFLAHFLTGTTGPVNDTQKKFLEIMSNEGDHLLELIDGLLEFSRIERGVFTIKKEPVQIDKLINGIIESFKPQLDAKKIKLTLRLNASDISFVGDELKIGQVLRNLIGNSIKFVRESPEIEVFSRVSPDGNIEVGIKDNGIGIDKDHLTKIFNKFYQVDASLTRKVGGLGLGLAISKEIIDAHGGHILALSEGIGKGSTFIFTLPVIK